MAPSIREIAEKDREVQRTHLEFLETEIANHLVTPFNEIDVEYLNGQVVMVWNELLQTHRRLIGTLTVDVDIQAYEDAHKKLMSQCMKIKRGLSQIQALLPKPPSTVNHTTGTIPNHSTADVKLPRMELPKFDGDKNTWISFRDMFRASVDQNAALSNVQKLSYLQGSVTGDAARLINTITLSDVNYAVAWDRLKSRFENKRNIVYVIIQKLLNQRAIQESADALLSLIDTSTACVQSLTAFSIPVDQWDAILGCLILSKVDEETRKAWELTRTDTEIPSWDEIIKFLEQRAQALAVSRGSKSSSSQSKDTGSGRTQKAQVHHTSTTKQCKECSEDHPIFKCRKFLALSIPERRLTVRHHALCFNCLYEGHRSHGCTSKHTCHKCKDRHHTLLHEDKQSDSNCLKSSSAVNHHIKRHLKSRTLFATAVVYVLDSHGEKQLCRIALDNFSSDCIVENSCVQRLGLLRHRVTTNISGLGGASLGSSQGTTTITFSPHFKSGGEDSNTVEALIVPRLVNHLPSFHMDPTTWTHLESLQLADPNFFKPGNIDILVGGDVFWELIQGEKRIGVPGTPMAVKSSLGWLVVGKVKTPSGDATVHHVQTLDDLVQRFWELESVPITRILTEEERKCEEYFKATHIRDLDGRFQVDLPFKQFPPPIGTSRDMAVRRLKSLERRLEARPEIRVQYNEFMQRYVDLGHMKKLRRHPQGEEDDSCYLPHHFVQKDPSLPNKFRVVFDASAKTSNGKSLNDALMVGPTIQDTLVTLLMRFRFYSVAFTADIGKMYRQILINPIHQPFQRIVWREDSKGPVVDYQLRTVTYGTAAAPFLATRVLNQLASDEQISFPLAATVATRDFYVDDLMSGEADADKAKEVVHQLRQMCEKGGFSLLKWASNSTSLIRSIPPELRATQSVLPIASEGNEIVSTLGINWNTSTDCFSFRVKLPPESDKLTKRLLLSEIAKIFDPLGWLSPTLIKAKILFQQLWKMDIGWDDPLPDSATLEWKRFRSFLPQLEKLSIPRCVRQLNSSRLHLHGFCDASERAYAAAVYLKESRGHQPPRIHLITAKTKVAPTKPISLPRLELCGALLLSSLVKTIQVSLHIQFDEIHAWTDSTVVLAWLKSHPSRWKTFVGNRVTKIQAILPIDCWHHVSGLENPADSASRGVDPHELINYRLWWHGPRWLAKVETTRESQFQEVDSEVVIMEEKRLPTTVNHMSADHSILQKFSCLTTMQRVMAWCCRFIENSRFKDNRVKSQLTPAPLTTTELESAFMHLVRGAQANGFQSEIERLKVNKSFPKKSRILSLHPFLDSSGVLRVGGRLQLSELPTDRKNPILLPRYHHLTLLVIRHYHHLHHHAGSQLLQALINERYWIVNARDAIRHQIKRCVVCVRQRASTINQFMGNLPAARVTASRPFLKSGVDYAGPFLLKPVYGRSNATFKAYLCLFVCFSTRALHLEVVSGLSTEAFLAALRRFISRRGKPSDIYSDQGTNFVGAARELKELLAFAQRENGHIADVLSKEGIQWHFNAPSAPHFGGIWEAGVKSVKHHLVRVIGEQRLNFEEFSTIIAQIEAVLNSRPLTAVSSDPTDFTCLTPGHFLIGGPLSSTPEPSLTERTLNKLSRWQMVQQMQQHFWHRWAAEYLTRLQQRPKWLHSQRDLAVGDLVIVKDNRFPPTRWPMARVQLIHPGEDRRVRVVTLRTLHGEIQRPIVKLCPLPIDSASDADSSL